MADKFFPTGLKIQVYLKPCPGQQEEQTAAIGALSSGTRSSSHRLPTRQTNAAVKKPGASVEPTDAVANECSQLGMITIDSVASISFSGTFALWRWSMP